MKKFELSLSSHHLLFSSYWANNLKTQEDQSFEIRNNKTLVKITKRVKGSSFKSINLLLESLNEQEKINFTQAYFEKLEEDILENAFKFH